MKKLLFITLALGLFCFSNAQQKREDSPKGEKSMKHMEKRQNNFDEWSKELNLTEDQKTEILAIKEKYKEEKVAKRKAGNAEEFKKLNEQQREEIKAVLTPDQQKKAEEIKARKEQEKQEKAELKPARR